MEPTTQQTSPAIPIAIICGFAMIAIAIFFTNKNDSGPSAPTESTETTQVSEQAPRPVTEADYIRGNPNAPILIIGYSDYDCPFCKQFHTTLRQIMDEYGVTGKVAWAYRQFPIAELHPNSPKISEAALCVGNIGGNDAFWKFTDTLYDSHGVDEVTNMTKLSDFAESAGVSKEEYLACINNRSMEEAVMNDIKDGFNSGARATPYTIITVGNKEAVINSAQSYDTMKSIIQNLIDQLEGNFDPTTSASAIDIQKNADGVPVLE